MVVWSFRYLCSILKVSACHSCQWRGCSREAGGERHVKVPQIGGASQERCASSGWVGLFEESSFRRSTRIPSTPHMPVSGLGVMPVMVCRSIILVLRTALILALVEVRQRLADVLEYYLRRYSAKLKAVNFDRADQFRPVDLLEAVMDEVSDCFSKRLAIGATCQCLPVDIDRHLFCAKLGGEVETLRSRKDEVTCA